MKISTKTIAIGLVHQWENWIRLSSLMTAKVSEQLPSSIISVKWEEANIRIYKVE